MKQLFLFTLMIVLSACSSVTVRTDNKSKDVSSPSFQKRYTYWWWGLQGKHSINVREVCSGKAVEQIQAVDTLSDVILITITLGIYTPRTARVWCDEGDNS